jgi:hypothetical protein
MDPMDVEISAVIPILAALLMKMGTEPAPLAPTSDAVMSAAHRMNTALLKAA